MEKTIPTQEDILIALAVHYSDNRDFLEKINKLTFGLLKTNNIQ